MTTFSSWIKFDARSLALHRVALALVSLLTVYRLSQLPPIDNTLSIFSLIDSTFFQGVQYLLAYGSLIALLFGYFMRYAAAISWFTIVSLVLHTGVDGFTTVVVALLLIAIVVPLNGAFSIDEALSHGAHSDQQDGHLLAVNAANSAALTLWGVVLFTAFALLIVAPLSSGTPEFAILSLHFIWPLLLMPFIPSRLWVALNRRLNPERHALTIFYDEPCGFCRKICYLFRTLLMLGDARIRAAQTQEETLRIMRQYDSWVVYDADGKHYVEWSAMLLLLRRSPWMAPLGYVLTWLGMATWGRYIYRAIAWSRNVFSKLSAVVLPYRSLPNYNRPFTALFTAAWAVFVLLVPIVAMFVRIEFPLPVATFMRYVGSAHFWGL